MENKIRESEEKYRSLYENSPLPYQSLDENGFFLDVNPAWLRILGYQRDEVIGQSYGDFLHPEWKPHFELNFPAFKKRGYVNDVQFKIRHKEGHYLDISFEGCIGYTPEGKFKQTYCVFQDITERKQVEQKLRESEEKFRKAVATSSAAINFNRLVDGLYVGVNDGFTSIMGYTADEVIGKSSIELNIWKHHEDRDKLLQLLRDNGRAENLEAEFVAKDGTIKIGLMSARVIDVAGEQLIISITRDMTEQRRAEVSLRESEQKFRLLADYTYDWEYWLNPEGDYIYVSPACEKTTGYRPDEFISNPKLIFDLVRPDYAQKVHHHYTDENDPDFSFRSMEFPIRTKTGEERWLEHHCSPVFDDQGNYAGRRGNNRDITERKQAQAAIEKGRAEFEAIFNCITDGIVFVDPQRRILRINAAFTKMFGYQFDELAGQTTKIIYANPEHYGQQGQKRYNPEAKIDRPVYEDEYRRKDGTTFFAETIGVHVVDESGTLLGYIGVVHDITERKQAEQKNKAFQQQLLTILNSIDANVYVSDLETNEVLFMNKNMIQDFGKDLTGETCWEVFRGETAPCDVCKNHLLLDENGQPTSGCVWESKNTVTGKDYINHDRVIEWIDGRLVHLQVSTDISHRKSMEKQLRQKYKMEAVGIMAGGMAHNFNNSLSIILGNLELAKMKMALNPEVDGYLTNAKIAVHRSTELIQKIVTYSRQGDHEKVTIQLSLVIKETLKLFRSTMPTTMNLKQHISSDSHDLMVQVDTSQVQECLINLLNNAMHAMDEEGDLTVTLEHVELQQHDIPAQYDCHPGHYAKLSVQDSGTGISAETIDKIFDLFFTTKPVDQGTGVGLSTVQGIVAEHGGMINVNSTLGEGSTFELYFPTVQKTQTSTTSPDNTEIPSGTGHILLVDDDPMLANLGERMLETKGYTVTTMTDSVEALKLFTANAERIDLLITDQTMPGLTGEHLIEEIKKLKPTIPTIICTGYSSKMDEEKAAQLGISAFLMKPLNMPQLLQTVKQVLDEKEG